ncbi:MAG: hypothetical protein EXR79_11800 [Myxococcales bacterium]|nr:hypothetical protein [Myxococcales bacterium]
MTPTAADLRDRLRAHDDRYGALFGGQPRVTRDIAALDALIESAAAVRSEAERLKGTPDAERRAVVVEAERQMKLYRGERAAVVEARSAGPHAVAAGIVATRANHVFHRYARHFAGQSRATRDASMLLDMIGELDGLAGRLEAMLADGELASAREDLGTIQGWRRHFDAERKEIAAAREAGTLAQQAAWLGGAANTLFLQHKTVFAGQPGGTRRPESLQRLTEALRLLEDRMRALVSQGLVGDVDHDRNLGIVAGRLAAWEAEGVAIRAERQKTTLATLARDLAMAADAERELWSLHFAGQNRKTRDPARLTAMVERMDEIERQFLRMQQVRADVAFEEPAAATRDTLTLWCAEWDAIAQARREGGA